MKDDKKFLSALGLCVRAGKVIFGVPQVCEAMRKGGKNSPVTVFEASDTSVNTRKRISDKCTYYNIKHIKINIGGEELAAALGKSAYLAAVAVTDKEMSLMAERHI